MTNYYAKYVEPILNGMGDVARAEIESNQIVKESISQIRGFKSIFINKERKEVAVSNFYFNVVQLYCNTRFMHQQEGFGNKIRMANDKAKYNDIYANLDEKTGKLNLPKKWHDIFQIKYDDVAGYRCRMRRKDKYNFYIVTNSTERDNVRQALFEAGEVPTHDIDTLLTLWTFITAHSQIKSTAPKGTPKTDGRGYLNVANEIWDEMENKNRILRLQDEIHTIQSTYNRTDSCLDKNLQAARSAQQAAMAAARQILNDDLPDSVALYDAMKHLVAKTQVCDKIVREKEKNQIAKQRSIATEKQLSGLRFQELRERTK